MSARPVVSARTASSSKAPAPETKVGHYCLVHPTATIAGTHPITIGSKAVIQLRCRLDSTHGPITIGAHTTVAERASIICPTASSGADSLISIGDGVIIETGATVLASTIGDYTIIEVGAEVGEGAVIGAYCKVCAGVRVGSGEKLEDGTVVWGSEWGQRRVEQEGKGLRAADGRRLMAEGLGEGMRALWSTK